MITIDKNTPYTKNKKGRKSMYPFDEMEVGDSFLFTNYLGKPIAIKKAGATASVYAKRHEGKKFSCRTEKKGVRIFRIKINEGFRFNSVGQIQGASHDKYSSRLFDLALR